MEAVGRTLPPRPGSADRGRRRRWRRSCGRRPWPHPLRRPTSRARLARRSTAAPAPRAGRAPRIAGAKAATFLTDHGGRRRMIVWHGKPRGGAGWRRGLQIECMLQFVKDREAILSTSCRRMAYRPVGGALIQRDRASNICIASPYISPYIDFRDGPRGRAGNDRLARETSLGRGLAQSCANWGVIAF